MVEFGLIAPVLILLIMGLGEILYQPYVQSVLTGAMERAGRDSTLEDTAVQGVAGTNVIDEAVKEAVRGVARNATFSSSRLNYSSFSLIKPEWFDDKNKNNVRDAGECFDDVNDNGSWDANPGRTGQGGADDVTVYEVSVTYPRLFPVAGLLGWSSTQTVTATTILKNQPYDEQRTRTIQRRGCS